MLRVDSEVDNASLIPAAASAGHAFSPERWSATNASWWDACQRLPFQARLIGLLDARLRLASPSTQSGLPLVRA